MKIKVLSVIFFLALFLISSHSRAYECSESSTETEKLICKECKKFNQRFSNSKKLSKSKKENFIQGCVATWNNSISSTILDQNNSNLFRIPSPEEYLEEFRKLLEKPYHSSLIDIDQDKVNACKKQNKNKPNFDCSNGKKYSNLNLSYKIFFPTNDKNFIQITRYSDRGGVDNEPSNYFKSRKFITEKGVTQQIKESKNSCSIPLKDPVAINGNIYLPEQISFNKFFNGLLGKFNFDNFQYYSSQGTFRADCLMRLRRIDDDEDSYIVFNEADFIEDPIFINYEILPKNFRKCALEVIKKNQIKVEEISKNFIRFESVIIKKSSAESILTSIKEDCQKYDNRKEECLKLNITSKESKRITCRIFNTKLVVESTKSLEKDSIKIVVIGDKPEFQNNKCYWSFKLQDNHESKITFWKEFLVDVHNNEIFEKDAKDGSLKEAIDNTLYQNFNNFKIKNQTSP